MNIFENTRVSRFLPFAILALIAAALYTIMPDYGMSWDEASRWRSGDRKIDYYEKLISAEDKWDTMQTAPKDLYPGLYDIPLALLRKNTSIDPILLSHFFNVLYGLLAIVSTFLLAKLLLCDGRKPTEVDRTVWTPYIAVGLLLSFPEFFGHIFINPKDIPFAATYALGLYSIARVVLRMPRFRIMDTVFCGIAVGMCMSARPPGIVLCGYAFVVGLIAAIWISKDSRERNRNIRQLFGHGGIMVVVALCVLFIFWPAAHRNPFTSSVEAVGALRTFSQAIPVLFQGEIYSAGSTPFYYVVWMFLMKSPEHTLILICTALVLVGRHFDRRVDLVKSNRRLSLLLLLLISSVLFPFAYVLARQPAIHNGFRHMLYVLPPLAVLLAFVYVEGVSMIKALRLRQITYGLTALFAIFSISTLSRLHPYQYVYYNVLAGGTAGSLSRYETEYWFTSGREAMTVLAETPEFSRAQEKGEVNIMVSGPWQVMEPYLPGGAKLVGNAHEAHFYIGNTQMRADALIDGDVIATIIRDGLLIVSIKEAGLSR